MRRLVTLASLVLLAACAGPDAVPERGTTTPAVPATSATPATTATTVAAAGATTRPTPAACAVAERVTGTVGRWRPAALPAEVVARPGSVTAVTATGARSAWAVGRSGRPLPDAASRPFALAWNGARWTSTPVPAWPGGLVGVAAVDARTAWAVGSEPLAGGGERSHLVRWDGSSWREAWPAPESGISPDALLRQVAADGCGRVYLVGGDHGMPLVARWDGRAWHRLSLPGSPGGGAEARFVSFRSGTRVWIGVSGSGDAHGILSWDGRAWRTERVLGGPHVGLYALTVLTDDQVWFVSNQSWVGGPINRPAPANQVFAATVSGSAPDPSALGWTAVDGVSGHAGAEWVAGTGGLARWDGRRWVPVPGVLPQGGYAAAFAAVPGTGETWLAPAATVGSPGADTARPQLLHFTRG
jgi:hypothetical protein